MWFQLVLLAVFVVNALALLYFKRNGGGEGKSGSAVLGAFRTIQVSGTLIFGGSIPNYELLMSFSRTFGGLMIMKMPTMTEALLNIADINIAKRIMNSSKWISRLPENHYLYSSHFNKPLGLLFGNGQWWKEARKLTLKLLHQLDFFRLENMERFITFEINHVKNGLDEKIKESGVVNNGGETVIRVHQMFEVHTLNIVYQVIMGKRFEDDDPIVEKILSTMNAANRDFNIGTSVLEIMPWLRLVPGLKTYMNTYDAASQVCYDYFKKEILEKRRQSGMYKTEPVDFADYFLLEVDKHAQEKPCYITDESFLVCMRDMVFAGSDTTNSVMEHGILHVSLRPEVQNRIQTEIDEVIGQNRGPSYEDRTKMPYTQAVLLEIMRYATPVPVTSRSPLEDNEINGDFIPKGSLCGINIYAIHRSDDIWEDPNVFRPERFLNEHGEICNMDKIIPFGFGKRLCVGESVARITLFIFFVSLLQKYSFEISDQHPPPSFKNVFGLSRCPMPYYVKVRSRFD